MIQGNTHAYIGREDIKIKSRVGWTKRFTRMSDDVRMMQLRSHYATLNRNTVTTTNAAGPNYHTFYLRNKPDQVYFYSNPEIFCLNYIWVMSNFLCLVFFPIFSLVSIRQSVQLGIIFNLPSIFHVLCRPEFYSNFIT